MSRVDFNDPHIRVGLLGINASPAAWVSEQRDLTDQVNGFPIVNNSVRNFCVLIFGLTWEKTRTILFPMVFGTVWWRELCILLRHGFVTKVLYIKDGSATDCEFSLLNVQQVLKCVKSTPFMWKRLVLPARWW